MNNIRLIRINLSLYSKQRNLANSNHGIFPQSLVKLTERFGVSVNTLHTSAVHFQTPDTNDESTPVERKYKNPVDWLPFRWHRRPRHNVLRESGDTIRENIADLTLPKPDFELSDELKSASPEIKHYFSLATGSKRDVHEVCKRQLLKRIQRHPNDYESLEVEIALRTLRIRDLFVHHKERSKWESHISKFVFPRMIQKRNQKLKILRNLDEERFQWILNELQLTYVPQPLDLIQDHYCKKWDLRRLTKEYCEKKIAEKKAAYHEELRMQQEAFLEEKKQTLAWIEEEEKAIEALGV